MKVSGQLYRSIAASLSILFLIFNVGLPVVLASCPMIGHGSVRVCSQCFPPDGRGSMRFVKYTDRSCCATVIAAERNKNEFVKGGTNLVPVLRAENTLMRPVLPATPVSRLRGQRFVTHAAAILPEDILLLNSSLLI